MDKLLGLVCDIGLDAELSPGMDATEVSDNVLNSASGGHLCLEQGGIQLQAMGVILELCVRENEGGRKGGGGFMQRGKILKESQMDDMLGFIENLKGWIRILRLNDMTEEIMKPVSDLWFKGCDLEVRQKIQSHISTSLPWILMEHILESQDSELISCILSPLEIYDFASKRILRDMKSQYLHDELTAEVNLCFDQFLFKLSSKIYLHYQNHAAMRLLPTQTGLKIDTAMACDLLPVSSFEHVLGIKEYKLLGRTINLSDLLAEALIDHLEVAIDISISQYEDSGLSHVHELESSLKCITKTHHLLFQSLSNLPSFDSLLQKMDKMDANNDTDRNGRLLNHTNHCISTEILPHFAFNSTMNQFILRKQSSSSRSHHNSSACITPSHLQALFKLLPTSPLVVSNLLHHVSHNLLPSNILPLMETLHRGIPQYLHLPLFEYTTKGVHEYFMRLLDEWTGNPILVEMALRAVEGFGNAVLFVKMWSDALGGDAETQVFGDFMAKLEAVVQQSGLMRKEARNQQQQQQRVEGSVQFHRVWSCLQFFACLESHRDACGDGLSWGGCVA
ncbi:Cytoplasmic FMR1-interacting protein 2 [Podochytrium sp. JEL0797]|nr:Cytoplasmic FMR1-interacting protein 2 [Podochytrium sp. JEL0797]